MLQFSSLAGLWALTALALPLALHLWRPPARTVRLGSVRFLQGLPRRRLNHLRWREHLLLLARLLLLTMLALLLASPVWRRMVPRVPQRWVLVSPGASLNGAMLEHVRALSDTGYELHRFTAGFPLMDLRSIGTNTLSDTNEEVTDTWSLIREVDADLPEHSEIVVHTDGRIAGLRGPRPTLRRCHVEWMQTPAGGNGKSEWIQSAKLIGAGESAAFNVSIGSSSPVATRFYSQKVPARAGRVSLRMQAAPFNLEVNDNSGKKFSVRLLDVSRQPKGEWVETLPKQSVHVLILHDMDRTEDARYVEAAVRAAAQVGEFELSLITKTSDQPVTGDTGCPEWIFWLSRQAVPDSINRLISEDGSKLLTDAPSGDETAIRESWIIVPADVAKPTLPSGVVAIKRRTASPANSGIFLWTDGFGEPLLTQSLSAKGERLSFLSRFSPAWSDLPGTGLLAVMMRSLFTESTGEPGPRTANDRRTVDPNQSAPNKEEAARGMTPAKLPTYEETDLHTLFWVTAFLCFCLERFLAHRQVTLVGQNTPRRPTEPSLAEARS